VVVERERLDRTDDATVEASVAADVRHIDSNDYL
jgi:hemin uptake protein HemP